MAVTEYGVNHPLAVKLWAKKLFIEALNETQIKKFMGNDSNSLIQVNMDAAKGAGDRIRFGLRVQLSGDGVSGDSTLESNEEALVTYSDDLLLDQLRNAVRSSGKMSEQRIQFDIREHAMSALRDWYKDRLDTAFMNQIAGNTAQTDTRHTGGNATVAPDSNHIVYPDGDTSEADVASSTTSSIMKLTWIDYCVERAKTGSIPIRPVKVNGSEYYIMFLHPHQVTDLKTNTSTGQWIDIQKAVLQGGKIGDNPIFTGAIGMHNGTLLYEDVRVPLAPSQTTVRRAIFCGAQAAVMAFGRENANQEMMWREELFDYQNQLGVAAGMIWGLKKTVFNSADFATIVLPTYAVQHGS